MIKETMFMHYRPVDFAGIISDPRGGATVAISLIADDKAKIAIAWCNPGDVFDRKMGRTIASGRLHSQRPGCAEYIALGQDWPAKAQVANYLRESMQVVGYE